MFKTTLAPLLLRCSNISRSIQKSEVEIVAIQSALRRQYQLPIQEYEQVAAIARNLAGPEEQSSDPNVDGAGDRCANVARDEALVW